MTKQISDIRRQTSEKTFKRGFSLIELLVVLFIFSILGVIVSRALALSLKGSGKSESVSVVKENIEYTASTMERLLRNAKNVVCTSSSQLEYTNENGVAGRFTCLGGSGGYINSGVVSPVRISSTEVAILCTSPVFTCLPATQTVPASVRINLRASHATLGSLGGGAQINVQTSVQLRNY